MADRHRALPPVHWRAFASAHRGLSSSSTSSPSEGLQSIGGLELVDNHSSLQESNDVMLRHLNGPH
ncbi:hypothetical protein U9M48_003315 [Paspalum notatum var. saurae]|uniref:Uncharacterized protein n=1 Tax=Paspalum notatum var. saurae TaxID=547442 RepID=A0AAQ3SKI6_PASNO